MMKGVLVIGVASILVAYLVTPLAVAVQQRVRHGPERRPLSRSLAILLVFVAGGTGVLLIDLLLAPRYWFQLAEVQQQLPLLVERAIERVRALERVPQALGLPLGLERSAIDVTIQAVKAFEREVRLVLGEVLGGLSLVSWLALAPLIALMLLETFPAFRRSAMRVMPTDHLAWRSGEFLAHVNMVLAGYVRAQVMSALLISVATTVLLLAVGVPNGLVVGLAAGVLEFLPVIGPLTIALAVSVLTEGSRLVVALAGLAVLRIVQDYVVLPRLLGRSMHLHPAAVVVAILAGAHVGGVVGVLVAVPLVGFLAVASRHWRDYRAIERLVEEHARARLAQNESQPPEIRASLPGADPSASGRESNHM